MPNIPVPPCTVRVYQLHAGDPTGLVLHHLSQHNLPKGTMTEMLKLITSRG